MFKLSFACSSWLITSIIWMITDPHLIGLYLEKKRTKRAMKRQGEMEKYVENMEIDGENEMGKLRERERGRSRFRKREK